MVSASVFGTADTRSNRVRHFSSRPYIMLFDLAYNSTLELVSEPVRLLQRCWRPSRNFRYVYPSVAAAFCEKGCQNTKLTCETRSQTSPISSLLVCSPRSHLRCRTSSLPSLPCRNSTQSTSLTTLSDSTLLPRSLTSCHNIPPFATYT